MSLEMVFFKNGCFIFFACLIINISFSQILLGYLNSLFCIYWLNVNEINKLDTILL